LWTRQAARNGLHKRLSLPARRVPLFLPKRSLPGPHQKSLPNVISTAMLIPCSRWLLLCSSILNALLILCVPLLALQMGATERCLVPVLEQRLQRLLPPTAAWWSFTRCPPQTSMVDAECVVALILRQVATEWLCSPPRQPHPGQFLCAPATSQLSALMPTNALSNCYRAKLLLAQAPLGRTW